MLSDLAIGRDGMNRNDCEADTAAAVRSRAKVAYDDALRVCGIMPASKSSVDAARALG